MDTHAHAHTQMQTHTGYTTNITHTRAHRHTHKIVYLYGNIIKPHNTQRESKVIKGQWGPGEKFKGGHHKKILSS